MCDLPSSAGRTPPPRGASFGATALLAAGILVLGVGSPSAAKGPQAGPAASGRTTIRNVLNPYDYFSNSWALIGLKDYPDGTRISPGGEFLLADGLVGRLLVGEGFAPLENGVRKSLVKGYLPIVHYDFLVNDTIEYVIDAFACPLPSVGVEGFDFPRREANFLNLVRVTLRNRGRVRQTGVLGWEWRAPGPLAGRDLSGRNEWALTSGASLLAVAKARPGSEVAFRGPRLEIRTGLEAGRAESVFLCLPFRPLEKPSDRATLELARVDFGRWEERTADFWEGLLARGARLYVPEEKVLDSYLASLVYQFIGRDEAQLRAGEGFYDQFYLRDGAYQAVSLAQAGFLDEARQSLEFFAGTQRPDGLFETQKGQLDANGYAVWALTEFGRLSGDNIWTWKYYPAVMRSLAYIRNARAGGNDPGSPFSGLLPRAPADGENLWAGDHHIVGYDLWNLRAFQSAAGAARQLAKLDDVKRLESEFAAYRTDILRAVDRTGLPYLPPSYEKDGTHWGNLEAVFPTVLIDADDRRVTATLDQVRDVFGKGEGAAAGFIEGVIQWTPKTSAIHPYLSLFVTNSHIVRGEQDKAVDGFYSFLLHSTSTQGFAEGVYYRNQEAWGNTIPHLWAAALCVTTLRNMLVREQGQDLHLLSAVPPAWLEPGKVIVWENVPTHFGPISLSTEAREDEIVVRFTRPARVDPERLLIHLPPELEVTEVGRCGRGVKMSRPRDVFIPGWNLKDGNVINICVRRRPGPPPRDFAARMAEFLATRRK